MQLVLGVTDKNEYVAMTFLCLDFNELVALVLFYHVRTVMNL